VLAPGVHLCTFCNSTDPRANGRSSVRIEGTLALDNSEAAPEWRGELDQRVQAYRAKRRKSSVREGQAQLPFDGPSAGNTPAVAVQVDDGETRPPSKTDDFAFTIAIGRPPKRQEPDEQRLLIDVSVPPQSEETPSRATLPEPEKTVESGLYPAASLYERRAAALIDGACLAFAYGGFLALFGSLGGEFTFSKLSATICFFTFAFVYLQYFGLFTIFGGTTPGMMIRGLQVASFTGDVPTPRQFLLRAAGYILSAGTMFLGFLWALWDEDGLTWHDRLSRTYLAAPDPLIEADASHVAAAR
jgi:uncharacterized RDD family membrane protein YckC